MKILLSFLLIVSSWAPLSFGQDIFPDSVIWGKYCGECAGNCSTFRRIDEFDLKIDRSDVFFQSDPFTFDYEFHGTTEPNREYDQYKWLLENPIPPIALKKKQTIFGNPDGYDQCGYLIDYTIKSVRYKLLVDPDKVPQELQLLIQKLFHNRS